MKKLPGRLGDSTATFETDERADPRIAAVMALASLAPAVEAPPFGASLADCLNYCAAFEEASALTHEMEFEMMPRFDEVTTLERVIEGVDGNDLTLFIHQPRKRTGSLPCVVHTHGGGMAVMTARDPGFQRLRQSLAATGLVVIGVEFRNAAGKLGNHPFPAGLNDCATAVQWAANASHGLDISSIIISGESGGGNLSIATTMKARQEGWLDAIDGVYAMCPYISGGYENPPEELVSLRENDGYMLEGPMMDALVRAYDPTGAHRFNPLAWPWHASGEDLVGLPPHMICVNELDPLRDEGLSFYRKLTAAGVPAVARTIHGTPHAGDVSFPDITPEIYEDTVRSISSFAKSFSANQAGG